MKRMHPRSRNAPSGAERFVTAWPRLAGRGPVVFAASLRTAAELLAAEQATEPTAGQSAELGSRRAETLAA